MKDIDSKIDLLYEIMKKLLLAGVVIILMYYALQGAMSAYQYSQAEEEYKSLQNKFVIQDFSKERGVEWKVDFEELAEINSDIAAWIRFEEPYQISYPVVYSRDNKEYWNQIFSNAFNECGTLFIDKDNAKEFSDENTFIYGHYMKMGLMFGELVKYSDKNFCREYPYFYIYTPNGREMKYQIFAVSVVKEDFESYRKFQVSEEYLKMVNEKAKYWTDSQFQKDLKMISLSTCEFGLNDRRIVVQAVKVEE